MTPGSILYYHGSAPSWRGGWRLCVVVKSGRKWCRLIDVGSLAVYRVHVRELERCKPAANGSVRVEHMVDVMQRRQRGWLGTLTDDQDRRADEVLDVLA
jgi:hypothetical protein